MLASQPTTTQQKLEGQILSIEQVAPNGTILRTPTLRLPGRGLVEFDARKSPRHEMMGGLSDTEYSVPESPHPRV